MVSNQLQIVVLSKDRAAQVQLCIESIQRNLVDLNPLVTVLYTFSSEEYEKAYNVAIRRSPEDTIWIRQDQYYQDVLDILETGCKYAAFMTDDDIAYLPVPMNDVELDEIMTGNPDVACISLRLGKNTYVQDPYNPASRAEAPHSGFVEDEYGMMTWQWKHCSPYTNFGYPASVDGHIFRANELKELLLACKFTNPNNQEIAMSNNASMLKPLMMCFEHSVVVNTPLNRVQDTCHNRSGEVFGVSAADSNQAYLDGWAMDFDSIDFSHIVGCHQELNIGWKECPTTT